MNLENTLTTARSLKGNFRLSDLPEADDLADKYLEESNLFFWTYDNWGTREYLLKEYFFKNSVFTIHPTGQEIKNKYLCAPARFLPFTPQICKLTVNGKTAPLKKVSVKPALLKKVYSLDNGCAFIDYMQQNFSGAFAGIDSFNGKIEAYDLSYFNLKEGDHLQLTVKDSHLSANIVSSEKINLKEITEWCGIMEKSLSGVLNEFGPLTDTMTQIEQAYFYGPQKLRKIQAPAFSDFIKMSPNLNSVDFIFNKIIWFKDRNPAESEQIKSAAAAALSETASLQVSFGFYSLLNTELQKKFKTDNKRLIKFLPQKKNNELIITSVRSIALWMLNSRNLLRKKTVPPEESLMLHYTLRELQTLCDIYRTGGYRIECELLEAFKINVVIIRELITFVQQCFTSQ